MTGTQVAPALLRALLAQSDRAADLCPGRAAGPGQVDRAGDAGLSGVKFINQLLELAESSERRDVRLPGRKEIEFLHLLGAVAAA